MIINDIFSSILFASGLLILGIAYFSRKNSKSYIFYCLITVAIYSIGYGFELMRPSIPWIWFWLHIEYIGIVFLPVAWIGFVLEYTGQINKYTKKFLRGMVGMSLLVLACMYTNPYHHLFYKKLYIDSTSLFPMAGIIRGPLYWLNDTYTYISMAIGFLIMGKFYLKSIDSVKKQIRLIVIAWLIPWFADIIYTLKILPFHGDLCPFAFSLSGIISSIAIIHSDFIRLTPIGMEQVFIHMTDGALIVDEKENIVNYNPLAEKVLAVLKYNYPQENSVLNNRWLQKAIKENEVESGLLKIKDEAENEHYFKLKYSNIVQKGKKIGKIILFSDVTGLELERQSKENEYRFLQTLMDTLQNPIYSKDETGRYLQCNRAFCDYFGIEKTDIIGKTDFDFMDEELAELYDAVDKQLHEKRENQVFEAKLKHRDNSLHDVYISQSLLFGNDKKIQTKGIVGVVIDITEQKKNQEKMDKLVKLKESMLKIGYEINEAIRMEELLHLILREVIACIDAKGCGSILVLGEDDRLRIVAQKGFSKEDVEYFSISLEEHLKNINKDEALHKTVICNDTTNITMLPALGGEKVESILSTPIMLEGKLYGFLIINGMHKNMYEDFEIEIMEYMRNQLANVVEKHKLYEQTLYLSRYDHLTNIFNRSYFESIFEKLLHSKREEMFYFVLFDINDLKKVNDMHGHLAGDAIIACFASGLQDKLDQEDFLGRYGGDEFVGVFFHKSKEALEQEFKNLSTLFCEQPILIDQKEIVCGFSYGFAQYPQEGKTFKELIKIADDRMYELKKKKKQKKKGGKHNVSFMG